MKPSDAAQTYNETLAELRRLHDDPYSGLSDTMRTQIGQVLFDKNVLGRSEGPVSLEGLVPNTASYARYMGRELDRFSDNPGYALQHPFRMLGATAAAPVAYPFAVVGDALNAINNVAVRPAIQSGFGIPSVAKNLDLEPQLTFAEKIKKNFAQPEDRTLDWQYAKRTLMDVDKIRQEALAAGATPEEAAARAQQEVQGAWLRGLAPEIAMNLVTPFEWGQVGNVAKSWTRMGKKGVATLARNIESARRTATKQRLRNARPPAAQSLPPSPIEESFGLGPDEIDVPQSGVLGADDIVSEPFQQAAAPSGRMPTDADRYQLWLEQNAMTPEAMGPQWDVPLHPAQEGRAAAQIADDILYQRSLTQEPSGHLGFNALLEAQGGRLSPGFELGRSRARKPVKQAPATIGTQMSFEDLLPAPKSFDELVQDYINKGIRPNMAEKLARADMGDALPTPAAQKGTNDVSRVLQRMYEMVFSIDDARRLTRAESAIDQAVGAIESGDAATAASELERALKYLNKADRDEAVSLMRQVRSEDIKPGAVRKLSDAEIQEMAWTPEQRRAIRMAEETARQDRLMQAKPDLSDLPEPSAEDLAKVGALDDAFGLAAEPTALEDAVRIATGVRAKMPSGTRLHSGIPFPDLELTPQARQAWLRWKEQHGPAIVSAAARTGGDIGRAIKEQFPNITDDELQVAISVMQKPTWGKLGNLNVEKLPDDSAKELATQAGAPEETRRLTREQRLEGLSDPRVQQVMDDIVALGDKAAAAGDAPKVLLQKLARDMQDARISPDDALTAAKYYVQAAHRLPQFAGRILQAQVKDYASLQEVVASFRELVRQGKMTPGQIEDLELLAKSMEGMPESAASRTLQMINSFAINNMLGSVMTQLRNVAGLTFGAGQLLADRAVTGVLSKGARAINRMTGKEVFANADKTLAEVPAIAAGYAKNLKAGLQRGQRYFAHETDSAVLRSITTDIEDVRKSTMPAAQKRAKIMELRASRDDILESMGGGMERLAEAGLRKQRALPGTVGKAYSTPTRALVALDESTISVLQRSIEDGVRRRIQLKSGTPLKDIKLSPEQRAAALKEAQKYAFKGDMPRVLRGVTMSTKPGHVSSFLLAQVMPFVKTSANIMLNKLEHSWYGPVVAALRADSFTQAARELRSMDNIGAAASGALLTYGMYHQLKKDGWEFYSAATTKQEREQRANVKIRLNGQDVGGMSTGVFMYNPKTKEYKDFKNDYPAALYVSDMAAWDRASRTKDKSVSTQQWTMLRDTGNAMLEASPLTGLNSLMRAMEASQTWEQEKAPGERHPVVKWLSQQVSSKVVPGAVGEVNRTTTDRVQRRPRSFKEDVMSKVPGQSKKVPPKLAWQGTPAVKQGVLSPFRPPQKAEMEPVQAELLRLGIFPELLGKNVKGVPLSQEQRDVITRKYGPLAYSMISGVVNAPGYRQAPEAAKYMALTTLLRRMRTVEGQAALGQVMSEGKLNAFVEALMERKTGGRSLEDAYSPDTSFPYLSK